MKKILLLTPLFISSVALAQFTIVGGGESEYYGIGSLTSNSLSIVTQASSPDEPAVKGNIAPENALPSDVILLNGNTTEQFFARDDSGRQLTVGANFEFNTLTKIVSDSRYKSIYVQNGATLKFNAGFQSAKTSSGNTMRNSWTGQWTDMKKPETFVFGNIHLNYTSATNGTILASERLSGNDTTELILAAINLTVSADSGVKAAGKAGVYLSSYLHFYYGSTLNMQTNVDVVTLCGRSSNGSSDRNVGEIFLNGHQLTCDGVSFNPSEKTGIGDLTFHMGGGSVFVSTKSIGFVNTYGTYEDFNVLFKDFNYADGDRVLFKSPLSNTNLAMIEINGVTGSDLLVEEVQFDHNADGKAETFYSYYVIPEPSTYAMILGAIAIAFVAIRRRR